VWSSLPSPPLHQVTPGTRSSTKLHKILHKTAQDPPQNCTRSSTKLHKTLHKTAQDPPQNCTRSSTFCSHFKNRQQTTTSSTVQTSELVYTVYTNKQCCSAWPQPQQQTLVSLVPIIYKRVPDSCSISRACFPR
jgi:hypothetical protein